jgi:hypothetical protein
MLVVENASSGNLILERESTSSSAANRITYGSNYGTSLIVEPNASVILRYDAAASRWRLAASGVPTNTSSFVTTNTFQTISSAKTFTSPPTFTSSSDTSLPIFYSSAARLIVGDPSYEMGMGIRFVNTYADFILGVDVSGLTIGVPPYGSGGNNYPVYTGLNPPPPSYESIAFLSMRL